jgi:hypothetical protein
VLWLYCLLFETKKESPEADEKKKHPPAANEEKKNPGTIQHILFAIAPIGPSIAVVYIVGWIFSGGLLPGTDGSTILTLHSIWLHFLNPSVLYLWVIRMPHDIDSSAYTFACMFMYTYFLFFVTLYHSIDLIMYVSYFDAGTKTLGVVGLGSGIFATVVFFYCVLFLVQSKKKQSEPTGINGDVHSGSIKQAT